MVGASTSLAGLHRPDRECPPLPISSISKFGFPMQEMKLQELKNKTPTDLLAFAESVEVENAGVMRKQELMFAILKQLAAQEVEIIGEGVVEVLQDGFGFMRSANANYLPGPG
jgi:transcription termination factor Rho